MVVTRKPLMIRTILGSCVCVCLFDPVKHISAMNHYMLAVNDKLDPDLLKYGDTSLNKMFEKMTSMGSLAMNMKAYVFGGSTMFKNQDDHFNIGKKNLETALEFLKKENIQVELIEAGGFSGRKIEFNTSTGKISFKLINNLS
jgi:chemotaxis protein CheD